jgi:hypothetical protein
MFAAPGAGAASSAPQGAPQQGPAPPDPGQARAALESLRRERIEGRVTDRDYFERNEYLARIAHGEQDVQPPPERLEYLPPDEQAERIWDETIAPAQPHEYRFHVQPGDDEALATDSAIRHALADAGIPAMWGGPIYETADRLLQKFAQADEGDIQTHIQSVNARLKAEWGDQYASRLGAVDSLIAELAAKHPVVDSLIRSAPYVFADERTMAWLAHVAERRNRHPRSR